MSNGTQAIVLVFVYAAVLFSSALIARSARSAKRTRLLHSILVVFEPLVFLGYAATVYTISPVATVLSLALGTLLFIYLLRMRRNYRETNGVAKG
ncbi:MAG TPA: hypothetical protein VG434_00270 [Sphingomicrobium sp.]|nr:hypothetical protein [Sphingomicrobium sp.]